MTAKIDSILAAARQHCQNEILPNVDAWNAAGVWPRSASDKAAALGLTFESTLGHERLAGQDCRD